MKVQLFTPCFIDQIASDVGLATYQVLSKLGCEVIYPKNQTCCGQAGANAGYSELAKDVFYHFSNQFQYTYPIVVASASCAAFLNHIQQESKYWNRFEVYEFSYFLTNVLKIKLGVGICDDFPHGVAFHGSCSALRDHPHVANNSLTLLKSIPGINVVEHFTAQDECCGFGGSFSVKFENIADAMADRKIQNIQNAHPVTHITSTDMSCLLHLKKRIKQNNLTMEVIHLSQILNTVLK